MGMTEALDLTADLNPNEVAAFGESGPELLHIATRRKVASDQEQLESTELRYAALTADHPPGIAPSSRDHWLSLLVLCRAYKLGKKRWLYNECRLSIHSESGSLMCHVLEASRQGEDTIPEVLQVTDPGGSGCIHRRSFTHWHAERGLHYATTPMLTLRYSPRQVWNGN